MFTVSTLLIFFVLIFKFLSTYIKRIRTGDPNENNLTYWMFSYDFKSTTKKDWVPEDKELLKKKRARNFLVFMLYLNAFCIFLLLNSFAAHLLDVIVNPEFSYPV
tara:strand:- start:2337 stop:2651 length:315 start_codon:yes stop_codon:yes gene_type:complete